MLENILIYVEAYTYIYIYISHKTKDVGIILACINYVHLFFKTVILNFPKKTAS